MVERKWHKKSRKGCDQCKQRRVKCDESLPVCKGCIRRQSRCSYTSAPPSNISASPTSPRQLEDAKPESARVSQVPANATELVLMHHFTLTCYRTCDSSVLPASWWQEQLPLMATQHDHLLYAMFSFTSLHLATLQPEQGEKWISLAVDYRNKTLTILPHLFESATRDQAEACFWSSALIGLIGLAMHTTPAKQHDSAKTLLLEVWALWKGTWTIGEMYSSVVGEGFPERLNPITADVPLPTLLQQLDPTAFHAKLSQVRECVAQDENLTSPEMAAIYLQAIDDLSKALFLFTSIGCVGGILSWFPRLKRSVIDEFTAGNGVANFVMIFYGVALHVIRDLWYVQDLGAKLVEDLTPTIPLSNKDKVALTNWSREQVCS